MSPVPSSVPCSLSLILPTHGQPRPPRRAISHYPMRRSIPPTCSRAFLTTISLLQTARCPCRHTTLRDPTRSIMSHRADSPSTLPDLPMSIWRRHGRRRWATLFSSRRASSLTWVGKCPVFVSRYQTLPGLALITSPVDGGDTHKEATGCSDGSRSPACFSTRLMWRSGGAGEFYTYFPPNAANDKQCSVAPESKCNPTYGASVGRGAFMFATGKWTTVSERVRLNTVGKADGEIELFVNGGRVINVQGLVLRDSDSSKFRGIMMQTFFGGMWTCSSDMWFFMNVECLRRPHVRLCIAEGSECVLF